MTVTTSAVLEQIAASGVLPYVIGFIERHATKENGAHLVGHLRLDVLPYLLKHKQFRKCVALLHGDDVGSPRLEFRSIGGAFGEGSVQIVVNPKDGRFYADLDKHNPLQDVNGLIRHNAEEVWGPKVLRVIKGWFRKR